MFSHVFIGVSKFKNALEFYRSLMKCLGNQERFCEFDRPWAGWHSSGGNRPFLIIGLPYDELSHSPGNGQMIAFSVKNRKTVDLAYELAISMGAVSEGAPGIRMQYHSEYYGAYFRDLDGNKLCVVCHTEESDV